MNKDKSSFIPDWVETAPEEESYRSIFKWGDPKGFKHPNKALYDFMKETLGLTDDDFQKRENEGHEKVVCHDPVKLDVKHIEAIKAIVGPDNVTGDDYSRVKYSSGMTMIEVDMLRRKGNPFKSYSEHTNRLGRDSICGKDRNGSPSYRSIIKKSSYRFDFT